MFGSLLLALGGASESPYAAQVCSYVRHCLLDNRSVVGLIALLRCGIFPDRCEISPSVSDFVVGGRDET
jgi:hypothetical protein